MTNKANATKAASTNNASALPAGITPEMIAAFMAQQAAGTTAPAAATKPATAGPVDYTALGATLLNKVCEVTKGKDHSGEKVKVFFVSKGRAAVEAAKGVAAQKAKKPIARCELSNGDITFMRLDYLTIVGDMDKADIDRLTAQQKAESEETLYVFGRCTGEGEKAVGIDYKGWMRAIWFPKDSVTRIDAKFQDRDVFEVPAWKVKQSAGMDSYETLMSKQAEIEAVINAK